MSIEGTANKISSMEIRGAGLIARTAASALMDYAKSVEAKNPGSFIDEMKHAAAILTKTRPTAVSLPNAVRYVMSALNPNLSVEENKERIVKKADEFIIASNNALEKISEYGARHISDGDVIMTHCNSQVALGCIIEAHRQGKDIEVFATEVRPRNQGLLTIRQLNDAGIKTNFIVDSAARTFIKETDLVIVGSDAVAVNGAVVNKIGTSQVAISAHEARVNVCVAAETYKFAPRTISGDRINIEERPANEVLSNEIAGTMPNVTIRNPAFDVTPAEYIDLIITEIGAIPPQMAYTIIREHLGWEIGEFS